jgi:lipopolysaccharide biosynthesis glycosyltransferase
MNELRIACQADADFVPHSAAMLHSVLTRGGMPDVHVHYLHGPDISEEVRGKLAGMVEGLGGRISFLAVGGDEVDRLPVTDPLPTPHWYRVFLPELLPEVDKLLYLDVDTIVLDSLRPLWETDVSGHYLAAVTNVFIEGHFAHIPPLGLSSPEEYFNTGVMLLNLAELRREGATERVTRWAVDNQEKLLWPEQDAMNVVLGKRRLRLHPRWNCMTSVLEFPWSMLVFGVEPLQEARSNPAIRHFEGPNVNKPWHHACQEEMRELYLEHRLGTPWPEVELEGEPPGGDRRSVLRDPRRVWRGLRRRLSA